MRRRGVSLSRWRRGSLTTGTRGRCCSA
uniref:Uncharacterized protein n=1 Tax=Arundo donax TaxID=35708 RepID=A0A0A9H311_ARUDO